MTLHAQPNPTGGALPPTNDPRIDPVTGLHRMSTTAGVGSQDYVEISLTAVIAGIFGLASLLSLIWIELLIVPVVGMGIALVAIRQIRRSNGTQTGMGIAIGGLVLATAILATVISRTVSASVRDTREGKQIAIVCADWGRDLIQGNYDAAYALFSSRFTQKVTLPQFKAQMTPYLHDSIVGPLQSTEWNGLIKLNSDPDSGTETADAMIYFRFTDPAYEAHAIQFRKVGGHWLIESIPDVFPLTPLAK